MKFLIVLSALVALAVANEVTVLRHAQEISPEGNFQYAYETSDGTQNEATGDATAIRGAFKFVSPEGTPVEITYVADENGFQPQGDSIPVAPEIPPQILRALEWIKAHPSPESEPGRR